MELSKAFDTLNHDLLITKLDAYGFDIKTLKLLHSYLTKRWQRTKRNSSFSTWLELLHGVPRGSVLRPIKAFVESQFGYCPLTRMFHGRKTNSKINHIYERALRIVYKNNVLLLEFEELSELDQSF